MEDGEKLAPYIDKIGKWGTAMNNLPPPWGRGTSRTPTVVRLFGPARVFVKIVIIN